MADEGERTDGKTPGISDDGETKTEVQSAGGSSSKLVRDSAHSRTSSKQGSKSGPRSSVTPSKTLLEADEKPNVNVNPFKMPSDNDIFLLRDRERQRKIKEALRQRQLKVHEKSTYTSRINAKSAAIIKPCAANEDEGVDTEKTNNEKLKEDQMFTLAVTRDRKKDKESLNDYINKKREMFLVQYSLGVKHDEMVKLEMLASEKEKKLEMAERFLEEDAAMFDEFLKENDKTSGDAIKIAEAETRVKMEKVAEIKRINTQIMIIKGEIAKYEDTLKEYQLYRQFLADVAPREWHDQQRERRSVRRSVNEAKNNNVVNTLTRGMNGSVENEQSVDNKNDQDGVLAGTGRDTSDELDEEPDLYFDDPQQLLDIFAELEEQNLSLIQNSQETEEALEEMKQNVKETQERLEKETDILKEQIEKLNAAIEKEEERARDLETKARMFSFGEFKSEDQERMLAELNKKVEEVYLSCIGDNEAKISTLQMLTNIENRLEDLFEQIEMMPRDKVEAAEKAKEKERRLKMRDLKMAEQAAYLEERARKALERSRAEPKKTLGRRLIMRSEPPQLKKQDDNTSEQATRDDEELAYYFMP